MEHTNGRRVDVQSCGESEICSSQWVHIDLQTKQPNKRNWCTHAAYVHARPNFSPRNLPTCKTSLKSSNMSDKNWVKGVSNNTLLVQFVQHAQAKKANPVCKTPQETHQKKLKASLIKRLVKRTTIVYESSTSEVHNWIEVKLSYSTKVYTQKFTQKYSNTKNFPNYSSHYDKKIRGVPSLRQTR